MLWTYILCIVVQQIEHIHQSSFCWKKWARASLLWLIDEKVAVVHAKDAHLHLHPSIIQELCGSLWEAALEFLSPGHATQIQMWLGLSHFGSGSVVAALNQHLWVQVLPPPAGYFHIVNNFIGVQPNHWAFQFATSNRNRRCRFPKWPS